MKLMILAALLCPGLAFADDTTCKVNNDVVKLEMYTNPNADIVAYRYQAHVDGTFVSINFVDGAYDLFIERGTNSYSEMRATTLDVTSTLDGHSLEVSCPN